MKNAKGKGRREKHSLKKLIHEYISQNKTKQRNKFPKKTLFVINVGRRTMNERIIKAAIFTALLAASLIVSYIIKILIERLGTWVEGGLKNG